MQGYLRLKNWPPPHSKNLLIQNLFSNQKIFRTEKNFGPKIFSSQQKFLDKNFFFVPKLFLDKKFFRTKFLFGTKRNADQNSFQTQIFVGPIFLFRTKIFFEPKFFVDQKLFLDQKLLWTKIFFGPNIFFVSSGQMLHGHMYLPFCGIRWGD